MSNFLPIYPVEQKYNSQNSKVESYNAVNIPYGWCFLPSNANYRQGAPGPDVFGDGVNYTDCIPDVIKPTEYYRPYNNASVNNMDSYFFKGQSNPMGSNKDLFNGDTIKGGPTDLQSVRPNEPYSNYYITLAANSLKLRPDLLLSLLFSDSNLNHIRDSVVQRVKEITADSLKENFPNVKFDGDSCNPCGDECKFQIVSSAERVTNEENLRPQESNAQPVDRELVTKKQ